MDDRICLFFKIRGYFTQKREIHAELMKKRELPESIVKTKLRKRVSIAASTFYQWLKSDSVESELDLIWCYSLYLAIKMFTSKSRIVFVLNAFLNTLEMVTDETYERTVSSMWALLIEKEQVYLPKIVLCIQKYGRPNYWEKLNVEYPSKDDQEFMLPWIYLSLVNGRLDIPMCDFYRMGKYIKDLKVDDESGSDTAIGDMDILHLIRWNRVMMKGGMNENCELMLKWVNDCMVDNLDDWQSLCPVYFPKTRIQLEKMFHFLRKLYS